MRTQSTTASRGTTEGPIGHTDSGHEADVAHFQQQLEHNPWTDVPSQPAGGTTSAGHEHGTPAASGTHGSASQPEVQAPATQPTHMIRRKPVPSSVRPETTSGTGNGTSTPSGAGSVKPPKVAQTDPSSMKLHDMAVGSLASNHDFMRKAEADINAGKAGGAGGLFKSHIWHTNRFPHDISKAGAAESDLKSKLVQHDKNPTPESADKLGKAVQDYESAVSGAKKEDKNARANDALKWAIGFGTGVGSKHVP
jgi:hypothetical protein